MNRMAEHANITIVCLICTILVLIGNIAKNAPKPPEDYPKRSIKLIVPFAPGGATDKIARSLEGMAMKHLGKPIVATNMPSGDGTLGYDMLAYAEPNGYTMGIVTTATILQSEYSETKHQYLSALQPLVQITSAPQLIITSADKPWQNMHDFITYAKAHPGEIKYAHPGLGTGPHLTGEMLARAADINIGQVPFMGGSETLAALLGGHVQVMFGTSFEVKEYVKSGRVKILAVAGEHRLTDPMFKDIPTFKEQGLDVVFNSWFGVAIPKRMDKTTQAKLTEVLKAIMNDPEYRANMEKMDMPVDYLGPDEFMKKWMFEYERLRNFVTETGIGEAVASRKNQKVPAGR